MGRRHLQCLCFKLLGCCLKEGEKKLFTLGVQASHYLARALSICLPTRKKSVSCLILTLLGTRDKILIHIKVNTHTYKMMTQCDGVERGGAWVECRIGTNSLQVNFLKKVTGAGQWLIG